MQPERELAAAFHVGRPTIREVLQKLNRSGWLTLRKGMPPTVNDFWKHGNVHTIVDIVQSLDKIPDEFVLYFLEFRIGITAQYVKEAVRKHHPKVVGLLSQMDDLQDKAEDYAEYDWKLQKELAALAENPVFLLTLNSFDGAYTKMAMRYFSYSFCREASFSYYKKLMEAALKGDYQQAEKVSWSMMGKSYALWKSHLSLGVQDDKEIY